MKNIAVIFGGESVEHDVSIMTALGLMGALNKDKYNVIPIYITRMGRFLTSEIFTRMSFFKNPDFYNKTISEVSFISGENCIVLKKRNKYSRRIVVDFAFNSCHGHGGEDGALQGLLDLSHIPQSSSSVLASATTIDKATMKLLFSAQSYPTPKFEIVTKKAFEKSKTAILKALVSSLSFPMIVKPSSLGSSIGISKATSNPSLEKALSLAFRFDDKAIVEKAILPLREINCAVLGNSKTEIISYLEEPISKSEILTFDEKYLPETTNNKTVLKENEIKLSRDKKNEIRNMSKELFRTFSCSGVVRIDYLIDGNENVYVNEINSIPGSLSFYLFSDKWEYDEYLDKLIELSEEEFNEKKKVDREIAVSNLFENLAYKGGKYY